MKAKTLQIIWHSKDPVFSIDFHPDGYIATGGGDKDIKLWEMCCDAEGNPQVRYLSSLSGHSKTINCVRFSHAGHCLASAGDSGELLIWRSLQGSSCQPAASPAPTPAPTAYGTPLPAPSKATDTFSTPGGFQHSPSSALAAGEDGAAAATGGWAQAAAWKLSATLRGHHDDVTDIAWAHDDGVVMSGSVENEVMMFDVESRRTLARLEGHRHYVQGVAWDPLGAWMVSQSADRTVRVHGLKPPPSSSKAAAAAAAKEGMRASTALARDVLHTHTLSKVAVQHPATSPQGDQAAGDQTPPPAAAAAAAAATDAQQQQAKPLQSALFHDESLNTFFRRLAWSPEGSLLAVPAGVYREFAGQQPQHATYIYARGHWGCPLLSLPCPSKASTVVRFCPQIFRLKQQQGGGAGEGGSSGSAGEQEPAAAAAAGCEDVLGLPYRLVLAVATMDSVLLYDMQTCEPMMLAGPLHYAPITDLAWSRDGSCLAVSSHDGYCSMVTFQPGELGEPVSLEDPILPEGLQAALRKVQAAAAATAAKGPGGAAAAAAVLPVSPKVAAVTPRPASAEAAAAATPRPAAAAEKTPQVGGQQQQQQVPKPRRVQPEAVPAATDPNVVVGGGTSSRPRPGAAGGQPRRLTPQPVPHGRVSGAPAAFGGSPAPAAAAAASASAAAVGTPAGQKASPAPRLGGQQQQQQQGLVKPAAPSAAAAAAAAGGRVGLAAVQAALAAAKKKAAAKRAADQIEGTGPAAAAAGTTVGAAGGDDDDVVIVGEVAGDTGGNKRGKLS